VDQIIGMERCETGTYAVGYGGQQPVRGAGCPSTIPAMTTITCTILVLLLLPALFLLWATESRQQRAQRWRRDGWTQQRIADRLGCSRSTVRRALAA
jgi:hypothetical protein